MTKHGYSPRATASLPSPKFNTPTPPLHDDIISTIATFPTSPHLTDKQGPSTPVELTSGFHLLGHPVGSTSFGCEFYNTCFTMVKSHITHMTTAIMDTQMQLWLFNQCIINKIPPSYPQIYSTTSLQMTIAHPGRTGMDHFPPWLMILFKLSLHASSTSPTSHITPS